MATKWTDNIEIEKLALAIAEGFQSLLSQFRKLEEQHNSLEKKLQVAHGQVKYFFRP